MSEKKLIILNGEKRIGTLIESNDLYTFIYDDSWIESTESFDISPNIKRVIKIHSGSSIKNFLENLLPEDSIRRRIAEQNKTDDKNIIRLLEITGRDSAGALQVYSEQDFSNFFYEPNKLHIVSIHDLALGIKKKGSALNFITSVGLKPSLAGAQDKIACRFDNASQMISFPTNGGATTHILKPNSITKDKEHRILELSALNELICMRLAKKILISVPDTYFYESLERDLFIINRYDRYSVGEDVERIHQIDFCQYFGISSADKYEVSNSGMDIGKYGIKDIFNVVKSVSENSLDWDSFLDWIVFNYLIGNTDTHLKNISLISTGTGFKLAPYYDMTSVSFYKYDDAFLFDNHFAFLIGGISKMNEICDHHWVQLAKSLGLAPGVLIEKIKKISIEISKNLPLVHNELKKEILNPKNLKSVAKILKYLGTSAKEKSYRCLINTPYKNMFKSCSVCGKLMSSGMLKKSVLGICSGCLMKI